MFEKTKEICDLFIEMGVPGIDLIVYHKGECVLRYIKGYSELESKTEMCGKERYNVYSCSKLITCTAAMQLFERGLFSLEDKLSEYMPEFENVNVLEADGTLRPAKTPIRIKNLFEMTSGFAYNTSSENILRAKKETGGRCQTRELMKYLAKEPLLFDPGDRWEYGFSHDILAALVEVISGERFEKYVEKNIFAPLGMNNSTFMLPDSELDTVCAQYIFENGKLRNVGKEIYRFKFGREYASGGAGCVSTVEDYIKLLEGLRLGTVLKKETVTLMATDRLTEHQKRTYWTKNTHGYGLGVRCPSGNDKYRDFGWGGAACAFIAIDRENEISLYFGAHLLSSPAQGLRSMLYRFVRAELIDHGGLEDIYEELKSLYNYNLTY